MGSRSIRSGASDKYPLHRLGVDCSYVMVTLNICAALGAEWSLCLASTRPRTASQRRLDRLREHSAIVASSDRPRTESMHCVDAYARRVRAR
jgi:hypothetical protein